MTDRAVVDLAAALSLDPGRLAGRLRLPLRCPVAGVLRAWPCHPSHAAILSICDGFTLFGSEYVDGFAFYGSRELLPNSDDYIGDEIAAPSRRLGIVPMFGDVPHCVSVRAADGAVVESDWESGEGERWLRVIAPSLSEYIATLLTVREAYRDPEDRKPIDWWYPYARIGDRVDLE